MLGDTCVQPEVENPLPYTTFYKGHDYQLYLTPAIWKPFDCLCARHTGLQILEHKLVLGMCRYAAAKMRSARAAANRRRLDEHRPSRGHDWRFPGTPADREVFFPTEALEAVSARLLRLLQRGLVRVRRGWKVTFVRDGPSDGVVRGNKDDYVLAKGVAHENHLPVVLHVAQIRGLEGAVSMLPDEFPRESATTSSWIVGHKYVFDSVGEAQLVTLPLRGGREFMALPSMHKVDELGVRPILDVDEPVMLDHRCRSFQHAHPRASVADISEFYDKATAASLCGSYVRCTKHKDKLGPCKVEGCPPGTPTERVWHDDVSVNAYELRCSANCFPLRATVDLPVCVFLSIF